MRKQILVGAGLLWLLAGCSRIPPEKRLEGTAAAVLQRVPDPAGYTPHTRQLVYVPVYSRVYWGFDQQTTELGATLSIRNPNAQAPLVLHSVKYFDSNGRELREYVAELSALGPRSTADFVIQRRDTEGGPGASFLVDWSAAAEVDAPVIESVMLGQHNNVGISLLSVGRPLPKASADLAPQR